VPKKKTEWLSHLATIEGALTMARKLTDKSNLGGLAEMDDTLQRALEAVEWLRQYPASLMEPVAALEHDQFHAWMQMFSDEVGEETRKKWRPGMQSYAFVPERFKVSARAWAKAVIEVFETGACDLRRRE
jgi:hypothetical protein